MPSWMARAACSSPSVSAVAIRSWTRASRSRSRSLRARANRPIATPATAPPPTSSGLAGSSSSAAFEKANQLATGTASKDRRQENAIAPCRNRGRQGEERQQCRQPPIPRARPRPAAPASRRARMASTACAWTSGPNSSAASGVAAMSEVPSADRPISTGLAGEHVRSEALRPSEHIAPPKRYCLAGSRRNGDACGRGRSIGTVRPPSLTLEAVTSTRSAPSALRAISMRKAQPRLAAGPHHQRYAADDAIGCPAGH